jgi:phosphohistidine phosphatase
MRLYLVRHGDAVRLGGEMKTDADRPLSKKGVEAMGKVARGMKALGCAPAVIFSSPLKRAAQTATILDEVLRPAHGAQSVQDLKPGASASDVIGLLSGFRVEEVVVVGHEPDFSQMVAEFLAADGAIEFRKGAVCCLGFSGSPSPALGTLVWMIPPDAFSHFR